MVRTVSIDPATAIEKHLALLDGATRDAMTRVVATGRARGRSDAELLDVLRYTRQNFICITPEGITVRPATPDELAQIEKREAIRAWFADARRPSP